MAFYRIQQQIKHLGARARQNPDGSFTVTATNGLAGSTDDQAEIINVALFLAKLNGAA